MPDTSLDVKKLSLADIAKGAGQLSLASALWIGGLLVALASGAFAAGRHKTDAAQGDSLQALTRRIDSLHRRVVAADSQQAALTEFGDIFAKSFSDPRVTSAIADGFNRSHPSGVNDIEELRRLVGWQLLAQRGRASFYRGDSVFRVVLVKSGGAIDVKWDAGESVVVDIFRRLGKSPNAQMLERINSELNRGASARIDAEHLAVRQPDDGVTVVSSEK